MNIFHRHKFDPEKWKFIGELVVTDDHWKRIQMWVYTNTCTECGVLVEKKISSE